MSVPAHRGGHQGPRHPRVLLATALGGITALVAAIVWAALRPADDSLVTVILTAVLVVIGALALMLTYWGSDSH